MAQLANSFGCTGGNVSPKLHRPGAPEGPQSFVITLYDPDATSGSGSDESKLPGRPVR